MRDDANRFLLNVTPLQEEKIVTLFGRRGVPSDTRGTSSTSSPGTSTKMRVDRSQREFPVMGDV